METQQETIICGQCKQQFASLDEEHAHTCSTTGFTPQSPEHYGAEFQRVSEAALQRGEARKQLEVHVAPEQPVEQVVEVTPIEQ